MTSSPQTLDYAPAPRRSRLWRWAKWGLALILVVTAGLLWNYRQSVRPQWKNAKQWYWQRQCLRFTRPAGTVVFQQCPAPEEAAAMVASGDYVALPRWPTAHYAPNSVALKQPGCFDCLDIRSWTSAIVFVHELTSPNGQKRLVVVPTCTELSQSDQLKYPPNIELDPLTYTIAPWGQTSAHRLTTFLDFPHAMTSNPHRLKIFAGQIDPGDASRFTIAYEWDGEAGVIDGQLRDDMRVRLTYRPGPAKRFPPFAP